ncbi:hypothetical protein LINPERPRIM_LOCUS22383 [Linum perenne]
MICSSFIVLLRISILIPKSSEIFQQDTGPSSGPQSTNRLSTGPSCPTGTLSPRVIRHDKRLGASHQDDRPDTGP